MTHADKLKALREILKTRDLDGYLVPRTDEYQGEYVPPSAERLAWLTGFDGSAGQAAVLTDKAVVMSDGRYTIQLARQVDPALFETADMVEVGLAAWLKDNAAESARIGYDPMLFTAAQMERLSKAPLEFVPVAGNLIDEIWTDRPAPPCGRVELFPDDIAGRSAAEKCRLIAEKVKEEGAQACLLTASDSIAWLLNVRGSDVPRIPVVLSYAMLYEDGRVDWFVEGGKIAQNVKDNLASHVTIQEPAALNTVLEKIASDKADVLLDRKQTPLWFVQKLEEGGAVIKDSEDPCIAPRACKTDSEKEAIIESHVRDGVALVKFLQWVEEEGIKGGLSELDVDRKLLDLRGRDPAFREPSFDTIAGWADNGAVIHYRVTEESNKAIIPPGLLLVDSGGQYCGDGIAGTTDVTRTIAIGEPSLEMCENFTRVLKGHIALARAKFPEGTTGPQLDTLARHSLWEASLDYDHGTGHGVGCYLSVHEEAASISKRGTRALKPGMLISNEPGYYQAGDYGIRIESLVFVVEKGLRHGTDKEMLGFDTVTLAPIDRHLIVKELLSAEELSWLNDYHARVYDTLAPRLDKATKAWLNKACAPL